MKKLIFIAFFSLVASLQAQVPAEKVSLFPNPASSSVSILIDHVIVSDVTVTVSDILGNKIETFVFKVGDKMFIDFTQMNLKNGIYLFKIETSTDIFLKRLVLKQS